MGMSPACPTNCVSFAWTNFRVAGSSVSALPDRRLKTEYGSVTCFLRLESKQLLPM